MNNKSPMIWLYIFTCFVLFMCIAAFYMVWNKNTTDSYIWKQVTCVAWVKDYVWKIIYKKWDNIIISWVNNYYEYWPTDNCPVKKDMYWNCVWEEHKTGEFVSNIKTDDCFREWNYEDMIINYNK